MAGDQIDKRLTLILEVQISRVVFRYIYVIGYHSHMYFHGEVP